MGCDWRSEPEILSTAKNTLGHAVSGRLRYHLDTNILSETRRLRGYGEGCPPNAQGLSSIHSTAATALVHKLTLVTRNISDVHELGVKLLDSWKESEAGLSL